MPVVRVDALCQCEGCSKRFGVELEITEDFKDGGYADFEELVCQTIRDGNCSSYTWGIRNARLSLSYQPTIQGDLMLCDTCSEKCDNAPIEGELTRAQVENVLDLPYGPD